MLPWQHRCQQNMNHNKFSSLYSAAVVTFSDIFNADVVKAQSGGSIRPKKFLHDHKATNQNQQNAFAACLAEKDYFQTLSCNQRLQTNPPTQPSYL